jgi:hypothetical protein
MIDSREGNMNAELTHILMGRRITTAKRNEMIIERIEGQQSFDQLFALMLHHEKPLAIRAAAAVDTVSSKHPEFLLPHQDQLLKLLTTSDHHEIKWHIVQLLPRITLSPEALLHVWHVLKHWALNPNEGSNLRLHALQALSDLTQADQKLQIDLNLILSSLKNEHNPSLAKRIKKLQHKS